MRTPDEVFGLGNRAALVTGGGRGLGQSFARALAGAGAKVMIAGSDAAGLEEARRRFAADGIEVSTGCADLADRAQTNALAAHAAATLGRVDILVANAGVEAREPADRVSDASMQRLVEINLLAPIALTRALAPEMKQRRWGRLIYVSSIAAFVSGVDGHSLYSATKAGLAAYARTAAVEFGASGVTANCIAPGVFLTDMARKALADYGPQGNAVYDSYANMTALGRWGDPAELEGALLLLASEAGRYITGTVLMVDGGFSIRSTPAS